MQCIPDAALIWPTSFRWHHTDKPEADCNQQTPRTTLHHVYVLNLASVRFPTQDQQPADLRVIQETAAFRRRLKTHCFNMAFNTM